MSPSPAGDGGRVPALALALGMAAICIAIVRYIHWDSIRTLISAHGTMHLAVMQQYLHGAGFGRPENPFFAGERLPYYWLFHYVAAAVSRVTGLHPLHAVELLIAASFLGLWLVAVQLGRRLFGSLLAGFFTGFLALAGTNPVGGWWLLVQLARGTPFPRDDGTYLWGLAHPVMRMARITDPYSLYGPLVNFFLNVTSRPLGLVLLLTALWCLTEYLENGRRVFWVGMVLSTALGSALAPLIGLPASLSLGGGLLLATVLLRPTGPVDVVARGRSLGGLAALGTGLVLGAPMYFHLLGRAGGGGVVVNIREGTALAVLTSVSPLLILCAIGALRWTGSARRVLFAAVAGGLAQLAAAVCLEIPNGNSSNFFHAAGFLLAAPAAAALVPRSSWSRARTVALAAAVVLGFSLSSAVVAWSYLGRRAGDVGLAHNRLRRLPETHPLARVYDWAHDSTPANAVFVLDPRPPIVTIIGNHPDFPAMTERVLFTTYRASYMVSPHADAERRVGIATLLVEGQPLPPPDHEYFMRMDRPLYILSQAGGDPNRRARLLAAFGDPLMVAGPWAVYRYPTRLP